MDGHDALVLELGKLLAEAKDFQFHDYRNSKYAAPKVELHKKLLQLARDVQSGKYDN